MDDGVVITMYFTDKIELKPGEGVNVFGMGFDSVDGFPLEFDMSSKDGGMTITAKKVEDKVDAKVFKYDDTGYKEMTAEDLQKMGMGGMGF